MDTLMLPSGPWCPVHAYLFHWYFQVKLINNHNKHISYKLNGQFALNTNSSLDSFL